MKYMISKEWLLRRGRIEDDAEINAGIAPWARRDTKQLVFDWNRFPIREMFRRQWFSAFEGTLSEALSEPERVMRELISSATTRPLVSFQRQRIRAGSVSDRYALVAWQLRVLSVANSSSRSVRFERSALTPEWTKSLVQLSSFQDGPKRAQAFLAESGIRLVIEPHLKSTHLDGAALLGEGGPVIGMTLRFDRLDNFWFVLLHEIIHVRDHLREGGIEEIVDDLEATPDALEEQTDRAAGDSLIPDKAWKTAPPRFLRSESSIKSFAAKMRVNPAVIAGRIRRESNDYTLFANLVGQGGVRRQFADIPFEPNE
jgi:HTH-type transcriptional regulator / antitoxin HigA